MKNRYLKNMLITGLLFITIILVVYFGSNSVLAKDSSDYLNQHTMFIDYLRRNFWASGDFFPQWTMNYGLGQSFVIFFYYGLYNPFVSIAYILPAINPVFIVQIIFLILLMLNSLAMTKLLKLNGIDGRTNTAISVLSSFSGVYFFHLSTHPMFVYYLPIMTFSLVALHYLVDRGIKSFYILSVGLIFFTNFTFAPIISTLQFFYFIGLIVEQKKFNINQISRFFKVYLIGVLMGMMVLIPTGLFMLLASSRTEGLAVNLTLFNDFNKVIPAISSEGYVSGIYIIGIVSLLGSLFIIRRPKYYIITGLMLAVLIFQPLNFAFNLFEYVHYKVYIMYLPIYWLMFAELFKYKNKMRIAILVLVSTVIFFIGNVSTITDLSIPLLIILSMLIYILLTNRNKYLIGLVVIILIYQSASNHMITASIDSLDQFENANSSEPDSITNYRQLNSKNNSLDSIYSQVPNVYSSLENSNYIEAVRLEYETPISYFVRQTKYYAFDNIYYQNLFALENELFEPNPIVYGVNDNDVYSLSEYQKLDKNQKLFAANQAIFTEDSNNQEYQNNFNISTLYLNDESITISEDYEQQFVIPDQYQNGVLNISFDADLNEDDSQLQYIYLNNQVNHAMYQDGYGINDNREITFRINTVDQETIDLKIKEKKATPITYSNFKITYQTIDDFVDNKLQVVKPTNFKADMNNSYSFDLEMDSDGYMTTTIPYDSGFKVYIDGEQVDVKKIDGLYVGAKVAAGDHQVVITYHIPGFKIGLLLTTIAVGLLGITFIFDLKKLHKRK